ncbi:MAG: GTP-binding protein [archaeon]|nr:GTP-binding protein [archaeon]
MDGNYKIEEVQEWNKKEDFQYKIVIVGDCAVGKSNLLSRFIKNEFNPQSKATIGVELSTKIYKINDKVVKLLLYDTAGQERFSSVTSAYYRGAQGAFVVYDITRKITFDNIDKWIFELKNKASPDINIILIGNKSDLYYLRKISTREANDKAQKYNIKFIETSVLKCHNIHSAFKEMALQIFINNTEQREEGLKLNNIQTDNSNKKEDNCGC